METKREIWIDNIKVLACVLVVMGHFFQSMTKSNILPDNNIYRWFNQTIYYFHVPLFFICSGYLYQNYSTVDSIKSWKSNILKKALSLGIPYFTFSTITWILKTVFSDSVNDEISGLFTILFLQPTSPYWYLYCLFFIFLITPTFSSKKMSYLGMAVALFLKVMGIVGVAQNIHVISYVFGNEIWFMIGMCLSVQDFKRNDGEKCKIASAVIGILFLICSILVYVRNLSFKGLPFIMGLVACTAIVLWFAQKYKDGVQNAIWGGMTKYTMPIFLMHTIFAAFFRSLLIKVGITNSLVHVAVGITVSFVCPIFAAKIMSLSKYMNFFLYPNMYINTKTSKRS